MLSLTNAMIGTIGCMSLLVVFGGLIAIHFVGRAIYKIRKKQGQLASAERNSLVHATIWV